MRNRTVITSRRNPKVAWVRRLQRQAAFRRREQAWVVEGVRLAEEALRARARVLAVFVTPDLAPRGQAVVQAWQARGVPVYRVTRSVMAALSATETPSGLLAVVALEPRAWPARANWVLVLDQVRDPGNLGTLLRTAWAAGVDGVALVACADPWAPKVVRAGMGAHWHVPLWRGSWEALAPRLQGMRVYVADVQGDRAYFDADWRGRVALVVGGEAHGPSRAARARATHTVSIPMPGGAESLNAAVAGGILLFEAVRQRLGRAKNGA